MMTPRPCCWSYDKTTMKPRRITIHCSATPNGVPVPIARIRADHVARRGWKDVGYHAVIQPDGVIETGRLLTEQGAHVSGANDGNVGVCMIGTDRFTLRAFIALRLYVSTVMTGHAIAPSELWCHHEFESARRQGKTCPNMEVSDVLAWLWSGAERVIRRYLWTP